MIERGQSDQGASRSSNLSLLLLVIAFMLLAILSSPGITVTLDEPLHYHYGFFVLEGKTDRIDDSSMPVSALNALPSYIAAFLPDGMLKDVLSRYFVARLVTILAAALFAIVVFRWSHALYGLVPAIFSTVLYVLDPNVIANSQLVTTDVFAAGMMTLSMYLLWRFANGRRAIDGIVCAIVIGLGQLVKYTAVALFPIAVAVLVAHDWPLIQTSHLEAGVRALGRYAGKLAAWVLVALATATLILNVGFLFNRTFTRLRDYRFRSDWFRSLQATLPALGAIPVPVPYPYLEGLDWMRDTEQSGSRYGNVYLLGHLRKPGGFPGYYFIASTLKVPIASQVLILASIGVYLGDPRRRSRFVRDEVFLLFPAAILAVYFNFFFNTQTGMRYYLVVFPPLYVFSGSLFASWSRLSARAKGSSVLLFVYLATSVLSYFPYFTPYFNEFVWDKTRTFKYLSDTNLEWGQSQDDLRRYLGEHPDAVYNPARIQPGRLVVGGSDLVGILEDPKRYAWLRDNFEPVDTIAYCYFVYLISPEQIARLCAGTGYCE